MRMPHITTVPTPFVTRATGPCPPKANVSPTGRVSPEEGVLYRQFLSGMLLPGSDADADAGFRSDSSTASFATNGVQLPSLNSSRTSPGERLSAVSVERSPHSTSFLHLSTVGVPEEHLSQLNQSFEPHPNASLRESAEFTAPPLVRPSSVNSRMNHLAITSPLASTNASQTSLVSGLQRERGIPMETSGSNGFRFSAPQNSVTTTSLGRRVAGRTAPQIGPPSTSQWNNPNADNPTKGVPWAFPDPELGPNPNAMKPTRGLPWAFPDPELAARPSSKSDHDANSQHASSLRRESIGAASVASSTYTTDSRLPAGQRRFEDDLSSPTDKLGPVSFSRDQTSTDLPGINHHHHQLQYGQMTGLSSDQSSQAGNTPYSRTPELRVSHKLAERKRRCEMKVLFEELRLILPADGRVSKSCKWEVLTKGVLPRGSLVQSLSLLTCSAIEYIRTLEQGQGSSERRADAYRAEAERCISLQQEVQELREEIQRLHHQAPPSMAVPNVNLHYRHQAPGPNHSAGRPTLPIPAPSTPMQGVQFSS